MISIVNRLTIAVLTSAVAISSPCTGNDRVDFNRDIRSLFSNRCLTCHGPDENERASELRLDTEAGSRIDLGGYAAVVPGKPDQSLLIERLTTDDEELRMPPAGKGPRLTDDQVDLVRRWIQQGAHYAKHWSYEKPVLPALPEVKRIDWVQNPIDQFVLARLEADGLGPSPEADRLTLARRVALDLTGLPPTWAEAQEFVVDTSAGAYARYVDRLLADDSFGERWARVWLDLARYADSAGYADDPPRTIWAFRDYVIRSLNQNKPFDQFTIEQIAGDLLPNPSDEQLIATAFHRNTLTNNEGGTNDEEFRNVAVVDRVNTTMAVWMGTTMACAQCHTHKFDPITQEEYFKLFAFFNNSEDADQRDERPTLTVFTEQQKSQQQQLSRQIKDVAKQLDTPTPELAAAQIRWLEAMDQEPTWTAMIPSVVTAQSRKLKIGAGGFVHAQGDRPPSDQYTIEFPTMEGTLTALKIDVPAKQSENFVLSQVKATWTPKDNDSLSARFIRIDLPGAGKFLHLAEIEAFQGDTNLAINGTVKQSSTAFGGTGQRAIDGNTDGDYANNSVTHTDQESSPWIEVDLGSEQPIDRIVIWNRTDGGKAIGDRIRGLRLSLLDESRESLWRQESLEFPEPTQTYRPSGAIELRFVDASADFQQDGFSAATVLDAKVDPKQGWAVAPQTGKPHHLVLSLGEPLTLADGELTLQMVHASMHQGLPVDHFQWSSTDDINVAKWSRIPPDVRQIIRTSAADRTAEDQQRLAAYYRTVAPMLDELRRQLSDLEQRLAAIKPITTVPVMRQLSEAARRATKIQLRGNYQSTGDEVTEGTPDAFHPLPVAEVPDRLALARWLVDDQNPLTARVIANRHWEEIFGQGIVQTSEEFGSQGEPPSHPLLLDWLAIELRDSGWDLKQLLKLLVTSATYRQSSVVGEIQQQLDPGNRLYWRGPRFRVSAEVVRDQALFVSGLLSEKMFGPPVRPPQPKLGLNAAFGSATDWISSEGDDRYRRGLYTTWRRSSPYPSMAQFDAPNREVCTVRRIRTNTPLQALVTLNDPVYIEAAQSLARKMIGQGGEPADRIRYAMQTCLIREPTGEETNRLVGLVAEATKRFSTEADQAIKLATEPLGELPVGADPAEYAAWTVAANVILNLDEMFMKR